MNLNSQKFLKTGDIFYNIKNSVSSVIHYLVTFDGQLSFEEPIHNIKTVLAYNGNKVEEFDPTQIKLKGR